MLVTCPLCDEKVTFPDELRGDKVKCIHCGGNFRLRPDEEPETPEKFGLRELSAWMLAIGAAIWLVGEFVAFWFGSAWIFVLTAWLIGWTIAWGVLFRLSAENE